MNGRVTPPSVEDIRRLMEGDGFADLIAGKVVSISIEEKLLRALAMAAEYGHLQLAESLVNEGADVGRAGDALVAAAENDQLKVLKFLLAAGVPVDLRDRFGATALMGAAGSGAVESVRALLEFGADPNAMTDEGYTALDTAKMGLNTGWWDDSMAAEAEAAFGQVIGILESAESRP